MQCPTGFLQRFALAQHYKTRNISSFMWHCLLCAFLAYVLCHHGLTRKDQNNSTAAHAQCPTHHPHPCTGAFSSSRVPPCIQFHHPSPRHPPPRQRAPGRGEEMLPEQNSGHQSGLRLASLVRFLNQTLNAQQHEAHRQALRQIRPEASHVNILCGLGRLYAQLGSKRGQVLYAVEHPQSHLHNAAPDLTPPPTHHQRDTNHGESRASDEASLASELGDLHTRGGGNTARRRRGHGRRGLAQGGPTSMRSVGEAWHGGCGRIVHPMQ